MNGIIAFMEALLLLLINGKNGFLAFGSLFEWRRLLALLAKQLQSRLLRGDVYCMSMKAALRDSKGSAQLPKPLSAPERAA